MHARRGYKIPSECDYEPNPVGTQEIRRLRRTETVLRVVDPLGRPTSVARYAYTRQTPHWSYVHISVDLTKRLEYFVSTFLPRYRYIMAQSPVQRVYEILRHPYFLPVSLILPVTTYFLYSGLTTRKSATISPSKPHQCCFRLDDETSSTLTLPDGRQLGYAEYGSATGRPILAMHGTPGSRKEWAFWDEIGKKYDARFIGIDRPGFGLSSPQESRMVVDIAKDVQRLTEHLNLEEYAVIVSLLSGILHSSLLTIIGRAAQAAVPLRSLVRTHCLLISSKAWRFLSESACLA